MAFYDRLISQPTRYAMNECELTVRTLRDKDHTEVGRRLDDDTAVKLLARDHAPIWVLRHPDLTSDHQSDEEHIHVLGH